jgi:hypothetical protein
MDFSKSQEALTASLSSMKSFNWSSLKKLVSPQASEDLNAFLEKLPQHVGQTMLIIVGVVWACAGGLGLYTTIQLKALTELRAELQEAQALQPIVPMIKDVPVAPQEVKDFVKKTAAIYKGLEIKDQGSSIVITADSTAQFGAFREAVGHVQNGGSGWRVNVDRLCVGRECERKPLAAALKINKVSVDKPG